MMNGSYEALYYVKFCVLSLGYFLSFYMFFPQCNRPSVTNNPKINSIKFKIKITKSELYNTTGCPLQRVSSSM